MRAVLSVINTLVIPLRLKRLIATLPARIENPQRRADRRRSQVGRAIAFCGLFLWPVAARGRQATKTDRLSHYCARTRRFPIQLAVHGTPSESFHRPYGTRSFRRAALHTRRRRVSGRSAAGLVAGGRNRLHHLSEPGAAPAGLPVQQLRLQSHRATDHRWHPGNCAAALFPRRHQRQGRAAEKSARTAV